MVRITDHQRYTAVCVAAAGDNSLPPSQPTEPHIPAKFNRNMVPASNSRLVSFDVSTFTKRIVGILW